MIWGKTALHNMYFDLLYSYGGISCESSQVISKKVIVQARTSYFHSLQNNLWLKQIGVYILLVNLNSSGCPYTKLIVWHVLHTCYLCNINKKQSKC